MAPMLTFVLVLAFAATTFAQAQVPVQIPMRPPAALTGVTWRIVQYSDGAGGLASPLPGTQITMLFADDGTVSGDSGCNSYSGTYQLNGSSLTFGPLITTLRACADPVNVQERLFFTAVGSAAAYQIVGDRMTISDAAGATLLVMVRPTVEPPG